jgi:hypothetical protein
MVVAGFARPLATGARTYDRREAIMSEWLAQMARVEHSLDHPYAWRITWDRSAELSGEDAEPGTNANAVGIEGPVTAPDGDPDELGVPGRVRFRLLDEGDIDECNYDNPKAVRRGHELYGVVYEGVLWDPEGEWPFGPLDDYGRPNYGCTDIQHFNETTGQWEYI